MTNLNQNEVAIEIEEILNQIEPSERMKWCIYRVPSDLRQHNQEEYTPSVVSIGPFHYANEMLQNKQTEKWEYFKKFVERSGVNLDDLVSFVEGLESNVRQCYAENIVFDKKQFVKIILLDTCFIIEFFLRKCLGDRSKLDSFSARESNYISEDLLLLENQLPFFVLESLFNWAFPSSESNKLPSFLELTFKSFSYYNIQGLNLDRINIYHFTDLLRYFYLHQRSNERPKRVHMEAGLKFEVNHKSKCLLDLQLSGHVLKIPKIFVERWTEVLFRNMLAFEQCHYFNESYITDYISTLDFLTDTDKDVDLLIQNGIIINRLDDSNAVAKLFNGVPKNVIWRNFNSDYGSLHKKLNNFCRNPYRKLTANLRRDYCKTPWQTIASIAGILILIFTLLQTIFSGIQIRHQ